jgi:orc1/cdc6 family replication initiation protein
MGELFNNILKSEESIFLNPQFLDYDFQPKIVKFRENQQSYIATCIKPLLQRRNGRNLIILGKPGVGKSACLRHVISELKEDFDNEINCIYVNCWKKDSSFKVISDICHQVNYKFTQNKNFDDLMNAAAEIINEKSAVFVLDEVDKLKDDDVIYSLLEDIHRRVIIMITNDNNFIANLDNRVRSRLLPDLLEFKQYNQTETKEILKSRSEYAFSPTSLENEAFEMVAKKTFELGDMRTGLFLLKQAGENAENKSSRKINVEHVNNAIETLNLTNLDEDDKENLIKLIKEHSGKSKADIFKIYENKEGKSYRTFQRKISELEKNNLIITKEITGSLGKETILNIKE